MTSTALVQKARSGDSDAFRQMTDPYRHELQVHCYRLLGSLQDAEDALQETLLAAWQGLAGFEERASVRTWLYRIATNRCLNVRRSAARRPAASWPIPNVDPIDPSRLGEVAWLEPYPDALLDAASLQSLGPEARYEASEAISLAFVTALQLLPARQRAVLILRDVLGFHATEVSEMLQATVESVTSALKRARVTLARRARSVDDAPPPEPNSAEEQALVARLVYAYEIGDVDRLVALLTDDVVVAMPPSPFEYCGRAMARQFHTTVAFRDRRRFLMLPTRANRQPAFGAYVRAPSGRTSEPVGLMVFTLAGDRISAITRFETHLLTRFGLPERVPT